MAKWLPWAGFDLEETGVNYVKVEFNPNRVDFSSYAGVARAFQGLMGWKIGLPKYSICKGDITLRIDGSVQSVRPYMLSAVVRNVKMDDSTVREIMEMQEDLHWGIGRDRVKASIGVHDLDNVKPPFTYLTADPNTTKFVPLGKTEKMTLHEILQKHEKGVAYKHLIEWSPEYPILIDADGNILSMPPVINGELTRLDNETTSLFLDVTGPDIKAVEQSLNVLVTALADMDGEIESVQVKHLNRSIVSPNLTPQKMKLHQSYANNLLGLRLPRSRIVECLKKGRLGARESKDGTIEVEVPVYRIDILHEVDLVEEVAIGYGYYRFKPTKPKTVTTGCLHEVSRLANTAGQIMIGLGFTEVMNFILTNADIQFRRMRRKPEKTIKITNPISSEFNIARSNLLPSLMKNLMDNKHQSFPQKIFEVSDIIRVDVKTECSSRRALHIAGVSSHSKANFAEIKSTAEALLENLRASKWKTKPTNNSSFIKGRIATIQQKNKNCGFLGEIHPEVLDNFKLENPVSGFEIDLEHLSSE